MPAPQRKPKQTVSIANDAIFAKEEEEIPFKPVIVRAPGQTNGDSLERFTEITMYAVAMIFVWGWLVHHRLCRRNWRREILVPLYWRSCFSRNGSVHG